MGIFTEQKITFKHVYVTYAGNRFEDDYSFEELINKSSVFSGIDGIGGMIYSKPINGYKVGLKMKHEYNEIYVEIRKIHEGYTKENTFEFYTNDWNKEAIIQVVESIVSNYAVE